MVKTINKIHPFLQEHRDQRLKGERGCLQHVAGLLNPFEDYEFFPRWTCFQILSLLWKIKEFSQTSCHRFFNVVPDHSRISFTLVNGLM